MDNDKINEIEDILKDEEFHVGNFEFKLDSIRSGWSNSLFFDFKVYNSKDESFCRHCLEESLFEELKPYLKYLSVETQVIVNIYDKNEKLENFYITEEFTEGLFNEIKKITDINFEDGYDDLRIKIKQQPLKIVLEDLHDYSYTLRLTIYAKYISHDFHESGNNINFTSLTQPNAWADFKDSVNVGEEWYFDVINNYIENYKSMECVSFVIHTAFI